MKIWEILVEEKAKAVNSACTLIENNKEFYQYLGRVKMLNELHMMLSDEALNVDVKLRSEVLEKG